MAAAAAAAAATLLYDQLSDLGDPLPAGVPGDEAGFCFLVAGAGGAAAVLEEGGASGGPLPTLARALVGRVRAAEGKMEADEVRWVCGLVWLNGLIDARHDLKVGPCGIGMEGVQHTIESDLSTHRPPTYKHQQQSVRAFLAARGCRYLEGEGSAVDVLTFLATELQVRFCSCVRMYTHRSHPSIG